MKKFNVIIDFVEGKLSGADFETWLCSNEAEKIFENNIPIPPYVELNGLYYYLICLNYTFSRDLCNAQYVLKKFLDKNNIPANPSEHFKENYELKLKITPKWLDIPDSYWKILLNYHNNKFGKELELALKNDIKNKFKYLKKKPEWLQSPEWPVNINNPLLFIGQLDISNICHDTSFVYIFYDEVNKNYVTIEQSM